MKQKLTILVLLCMLLFSSCSSSNEPLVINDGEISFEAQKSWHIKDKKHWGESFDGEMDLSSYLSILEYVGTNPGTISIEKVDSDIAERLVYQTASLLQTSVDAVGKEQAMMEFQLGDISYEEREVKLLMKLLEDGQLSKEESNQLRLDIVLGETVYNLQKQIGDFSAILVSDIQLLGQAVPTREYIYSNAMGDKIQESVCAIIDKSNFYVFTAWAHESHFEKFVKSRNELFSTIKINGSSSLPIENDPLVLSELENLYQKKIVPLIPEKESGFTQVDPSDYASYFSSEIDLSDLSALYEGPSGSVLQIWQSDINYVKGIYEQTIDFMNQAAEKHPEDFQTKIAGEYGYSAEEAAYFAKVYTSEELTPDEQDDFFQKVIIGDWAYVEEQEGATILDQKSIQAFSKTIDYIELSLNSESNHYELITSVYPDDQSVYDIRFYGKKESYDKDKEAALTFIQSLKK